jgi:predicted TPR repeat methyltransferase
MSSSDFEQADQFAESYDATVLQYGWNSPQVIFDLVEESLGPGDRLLDLGIGTGLSAVPFRDAGVQVFGVDGSMKMLECCESKRVAVELTQHDIRSIPIPYVDQSFDHVIACGVFHLIGHLDGIFAEVKRLMRGGGAFAFTIEKLDEERKSEGTLIDDGVLQIDNATSGVESYLHSAELVEDLLNGNGFTATRTVDYVAYRKTDWAEERSFRAYLARQRGQSV